MRWGVANTGNSHGIIHANAFTACSYAALSVAGLVSADQLAAEPAGLAIFLAVAVNSLTKWILSLMAGTREMALWLGAGLLSMLAAGFLLYSLTLGLPG